ncbi:transmembrane protein 131 isoform X2 [Rhynchophorus ferrugineus]|uniref:transmembrane protein 131 isoform X2 n=1 Tax=Rhynchophorus ferrugineus TaxID=354439 RepID=UPI003FCD94BD
MLDKLVPYYVFVITFLKLITITHLTFHDSSHGFITKSSRYLEDELSHFHEEISSLRYMQKLDSPERLSIRFEPDYLDFRERPLGVPHSETVRLFNTDNNKTIDLSSISGNTVHFHSSFFEDKKIPPNGNTSFKVVYLGRQEGPVESSLFLHTSIGFIKYNVKAFGTFSNYRVRPIVGIKLPINSTFTPVIYMHNPHLEPIQIVEVYSSGGGFHLELPSGQHEGPNDLWEINPQETKAIIRVRFEAKIAQNHTAYIRIKLLNPEETLIVPLEVEVAPAQNIFHPQGHVDFGVGGSMDLPKEVNLCLFNPLKRPIRIHSVSTLSKSIKTQYYNIRINPGNDDENVCVNVGTLTVDWKNAWKNQDYYGKIIVKFRNGKNRTEIPYYITVLNGGLSFDKASTTYFLNDKEIDTTQRKFQVLNEFLQPIKILDVKYPSDVDSVFKIETFTPKIIKPLETDTLFNIKLKNNIKRNNMQLNSYIKLITNVSDIQVPLLGYNGKVQIHLPPSSNDYSLNVGLISSWSTKSTHFVLTNPNPVDLPLSNLQNIEPMIKLSVEGCDLGDHKKALSRNEFSNLKKCDKIPANGYAIIGIRLTTEGTEGPVKEKIEIQTPYENLSLPISFKVSSGTFSLSEGELIFDNCFPTKVCSHLLRVHSTFPIEMSVVNITPLDKRVSISITGKVLPNKDVVIGQIFFNPDTDCSQDCYVGFLNEGSASWLRSMAITKQVLEYDLQLVNTFYNRFLNFSSNGSRLLTNLSLDTSEIKRHLFQSKIRYVWPSILSPSSQLNDSILEFPLTQIGNSTHQDLLIYNPSDHNLVVQLMLESDYPHVDMLCDGVPPSFVPQPDVKSSAKGFFFDKKAQDSYRDFFWEDMRVNVYRHSLPLLLTPGQTKRVVVGFAAEDAKAYSSLLLLRNNLTIMEAVRLKAKGTVPVFKFGNRKPGAPQPLTFEVNEKYLKECVKEDDSGLPNLTVRRTFTAKNLGEVAVHVYGFQINGYHCEGFGFKVLNCDPFILQPNSSKRIEIAFTPDLTLSKVSRTLILATSLNAFVNYSLYATIPYAYCHACDRKIERPSWEIRLSYAAIGVMIVMLIVIVFIAFLEAEAIKRQAWDVFITSNAPPVLPVLDLRKIGRQVKEEMQFKDKKRAEPEMVSEPTVPPEPNGQEVVRSEPAIIPTTGKAKRKLAQKNSFNEEGVEAEEDVSLEKTDGERNRERQTKKDILFERHRLKSRERKTEKELKMLEERERKEKHAQQKEAEAKKARTVTAKKSPKSTQEEEASSTTTESSNSSTNCDEVDKENQVKGCYKNSTDTPPEKHNKPKDNVNSTEHKNKHVSFVNSKLKNKAKTPEKTYEQEGGPEKVFPANNRDTKRRNDKVKERKEKSIYRNKNLNERRARTSESDSISEKESSKSPVSFYVPLPTNTVACSGWSQNRVKFSDVVAGSEPQSPSVSPHASDSSRNEQARPSFASAETNYYLLQNVANPSSPARRDLDAVHSPGKATGKPVVTKPTMFVEPYKPIDLGPIGSKRLGTPGKNSPDLFAKERHPSDDYSPSKHHSANVPANPYEFSPMNDKSVIAAISNNTLLSNDRHFYAQASGIRLDGVEQNMYNKSVSGIELWNHHQQQQRQQQAMLKTYAPDQDQRLPETVDDSWNRAMPPIPNDYWSNTFSSVLESTSNLGSNAAYLWGANQVWKPWSPAELSGTPRRTPPGFDEQIQKKKLEEQEQMRTQQRDSGYSPFGSGCTWAQQKDTWD